MFITQLFISQSLLFVLLFGILLLFVKQASELQPLVWFSIKYSCKSKLLFSNTEKESSSSDKNNIGAFSKSSILVLLSKGVI